MSPHEFQNARHTSFPHNNLLFTGEKQLTRSCSFTTISSSNYHTFWTLRIHVCEIALLNKMSRNEAKRPRVAHPQ